MRQRVAIVGCGGHGREVADFVLSGQTTEPAELVGFFDDNSSLHGRDLMGCPVLGGVSDLAAKLDRGVKILIGIGSPRIVKQIASRVETQGFHFHRMISLHATVSPRAQVGRGALIFPGAIVNCDTVIGDFVTLNVGTSISHDTSIGPYSNINPGARLAGSVKAGEGVFVGMGAQVIQGRNISDWAVIGAGAVVIADIPFGVTAVGVPAKVMRESEVKGH